MWKTVQNHSAPLQYLNSFFLNKSSVQDLWPFHSVHKVKLPCLQHGLWGNYNYNIKNKLIILYYVKFYT